MKKNILKIATIGLMSMIALVGVAQTHSDNGDDDKKKKKIEKRVEIHDENGELTVTVTTTEDGKTKKEVYTGDEAKKYLEEQDDHNVFFQSEDMDIDVDIDGLNFDWVEGMDFNGKSEEEIREMIHEQMKSMEGDFSSFHMSLDSLNDHMIFRTGENGEVVIVNGEDVTVRELSDADGGHTVKTHVMIIKSDGEITEEELENVKHSHVYVYNSNNNGETSSSTVVVERIFKVEDVENENKAEELSIESFELYPNPNDGQFQLKFSVEKDSPTLITVSDLNGKKVFEKRVKGAGEHNVNLDLSNNEKGVYLLTLTQNKKVETKKIIIQ